MVKASETGTHLMVFLILLDLTIIILLEVLDPFVIKLYIVSYEVNHYSCTILKFSSHSFVLMFIVLFRKIPSPTDTFGAITIACA